jgi:uncharacterized coiled-coil protein SlyX
MSLNRARPAAWVSITGCPANWRRIPGSPATVLAETVAGLRAANARLREPITERDALIAELQEQVAEISELREQIGQLRQQVADLTARVKQNSKNTSRPPSDGLGKPERGQDVRLGRSNRAGTIAANWLASLSDCAMLPCSAVCQLAAAICGSAAFVCCPFG